MSEDLSLEVDSRLRGNYESVFWAEEEMVSGKAIVMDGKRLADEIKETVAAGVRELENFGIEVGLALLLVGDNPASKQYFLATKKAARKVGVTIYEYVLPGHASMGEILNIVHSVNRDEQISGVLPLMPFPARLDTRRVVNAISPGKDVDGLGAISIGRLQADEPTIFIPCTPFGVIRLLDHYGVNIRGKNAVVVGKSLAVGKPLANMLLAREATVTVCHRQTGDLAFFTRAADIICSAAGVKDLIGGQMIKEGAAVVDIGINVLADGGIVGDVDFGSVRGRAGYLTPVPGGVGPVTIAMLLENTLKSAKRSASP